MLHHPYCKRGRKCYITPTFSRIPNAKRGEQKNHNWSPTKRNKITTGCLTLAFSGAQKRAEMLHYPCILGDPQRQARGAKNQKWSPTKGNKIRSGCLTPAFSGRKCYATPAFSGIPNAKRGEQKIRSGPRQNFEFFFHTRLTPKKMNKRLTLDTPARDLYTAHGLLMEHYSLKHRVEHGGCGIPHQCGWSCRQRDHH